MIQKTNIMKNKMPKDGTTEKIINALVAPMTVLHLLSEGRKVPKDFLKVATKSIDEVARLSKEYRKKGLVK